MTDRAEMGAAGFSSALGWGTTCSSRSLRRDLAEAVLDLRATEDGKKPVKQIVFEGERFDVMSVRRWRDRVLDS